MFSLLCHFFKFYTNTRKKSKDIERNLNGSHIDYYVYNCYMLFNSFIRKLAYQKKKKKTALKTEKDPSVGVEFIIGQMSLFNTSSLLSLCYINQFLLYTCILSEVTKVTKFIEGGDGHLFEDEEIKRLLQGG